MHGQKGETNTKYSLLVGISLERKRRWKMKLRQTTGKRVNLTGCGRNKFSSISRVKLSTSTPTKVVYLLMDKKYECQLNQNLKYHKLSRNSKKYTQDWGSHSSEYVDCYLSGCDDM